MNKTSLLLPFSFSKEGEKTNLMNQSIKYIILVITVAIFFGCSAPKNEPGEQRSNVLLIVSDDQGYADFSPFQNHSPEASTPNLEQLAESGMIFPQAYTTAPVCSPSRAGLNTGKYQFRWDEKPSWGPGLPDKVKTIAEY